MGFICEKIDVGKSKNTKSSKRECIAIRAFIVFYDDEVDASLNHRGST